MLYHLFIAGRRKCCEEGEEVTVTLEHILRFTTGSETESLRRFQIALSIIFVASGPGKPLPTSNSCINQLILPRTGNLYKLLNEKDLFWFLRLCFSQLLIWTKINGWPFHNTYWLFIKPYGRHIYIYIYKLITVKPFTSIFLLKSCYFSLFLLEYMICIYAYTEGIIFSKNGFSQINYFRFVASAFGISGVSQFFFSS